MKKLLYLLVPAMLLTFASCKDDNPPPTPDYASQITGNYTGWFDIYAKVDNVWEELVGAEQPNGFELSRTSNTVVALIIGELNFLDDTVEPAEQLNLLNIVIPNILVSKNGTTYTITVQNAPITMTSEGPIGYNSGIASLSGVINPASGGESHVTIEMELRDAEGGEIIAYKPVKIVFDTFVDDI